MEEYERKMAAAKAAVDDEATWTAFETALKKNGGKTDLALKKCSYEDLEEFGLPRLTAKIVADIFRGEEKKPAETSAKPAVIVTANQAKRATVATLVISYDPDDSSDIIHSELIRRLGGNLPCIVFGKDGKVNVDASTKLANEIIVDKLAPRSSYVLDGVPIPVYRIGDNPMRMYDEDPLFKGERLRSDGTSDRVPFSWQPIPLPIRQLVRLAAETGEVDSRKPQDTVDLVEKYRDDITALRRRWPKASMKFSELETTGQLPALKIRMGNGKAATLEQAAKSPFAIEGEGRNRRY